MLLMFAVAWGAVACVWEVIAVPLAVYRLARNPALRLRTNVLAVSAGAAYILLSVAFAVGLRNGTI